MPEFILDTSGGVAAKAPGFLNAHPTDQAEVAMYGKAGHPGRQTTKWSDLDAFTQGYIETLFFTENEPGTTREDRMTTHGTVRKSWEHDEREGRHKDMPGDYGFSDLAPETLASIIEDCAQFQRCAGPLLDQVYGHEFPARVIGDGTLPDSHRPAWDYDAAAAGRDFWYTRNGHGVGFWDRGLGELGDRLSTGAKAFREIDAYLGDDGKVYLS